MMSEEIQRAVEDVKVAENHLNHCDEDFVETAIHELNMAESRLNSLLARSKHEKS